MTDDQLAIEERIGLYRAWCLDEAAAREARAQLLPPRARERELRAVTWLRGVAAGAWDDPAALFGAWS